MNVIADMRKYGHRQIVFANDEASGLRAIIAIHDITLGPALGGTRVWDYATEEDALFDVLRLSQGMTLKNAAAGLPLGGGKAVILGDAKKIKSPALLAAYAGFLNALGGLYYTAEDVGFGTEDVDILKQHTDYVVGSSGASADPSPFTGKGVFVSMRAGLKSRFGSESLAGLTVAVQGLGNVGYALCALLHAQGARLIVGDLDEQKVARAVAQFGAQQALGDIRTARCDVFAPCAMGAVIDERIVPALRCRMVAGSANNILATPEAGEALHARGILYLPDYIVNAGGVINCGAELIGQYDRGYIDERVEAIYDTTLAILEEADKKGVAPHVAADLYAKGILDRAKG